MKSLVVSACLIILSLLLPPAHAFAGNDTLNTKTYKSSDGSWTVIVQPDTPKGDAGATYTVTHAKEPAWTKQLPFALWDAVITDGGVIAGYAYENGLDGRGFNKPNRNGEQSDLYAVIIDQTGKVRLQDARPRTHPNMLSTPPPAYEPIAAGVSADSGSDTMVVRIQANFGENDCAWWRYKLSTGEKLGDITPAQPKQAGQFGFHREITTLPIAGTLLLLIHWYVAGYAENKSTSAARMQLVDLAGKEHWALDLPDEYADLGSNWSWHYDLVEPGIRQIAASGSKFSVASYSLKSKIDFAITGDAAAGWKVTETSRAAHELTRPLRDRSVQRVDVAEVPLTLLGTIKLGTPKDPASEIDGVFGFSIDEQNRLGFIRRAPDNSMTFLLVASDGNVTARFPLPKDDRQAVAGALWLAPEKWLIYNTGLGDKLGASASVLDTATGTFTKLDLGIGGIRTAARTADGGFVVIGGENWVGASSLIAFDAKGKKLWSAGLFSPQDVATTTNGEVVALEGIRNQFRLFAAKTGEELRTISLADAIGYNPNYPTGVKPDSDGGFILYDFGGSRTIRRISAAGKETSNFTPAFEGGRTFRISGDVQRAPDGSLWTSDSHSLLRLTPDGLVDRVLGQKPGEGGLGKVRALTIGPTGMIYAISDRDARVHVFGADGKPQRVLEPKPDDFGVETGLGSITIADQGDVYYYPDDQYINGGRKGYLRFDAEGRRVGFEDLGSKASAGHWYFQPGTRKRWAVGFDALALVDADGKVVRNIDKRPNGDWLERPQHAAVARDGSLAVVATPDGWDARGPATINIYKPDGSPVKTLPLPGQSIFARVALFDRAVISTDGSEILIHPLDGGPLTRATLPQEQGEEDWWTLYPSPDGKELWGWKSQSAEIYRFKLPW
ncbi:MAG: hypothetical protein ACREJO_05445 [Phycisphaerales bacterium]